MKGDVRREGLTGMRQKLRIYSGKHSKTQNEVLRQPWKPNWGGNTCRSKQRRNRGKVTKRYVAIHTSQTVHPDCSGRLELETKKIEERVVIRYFIKNSLVRRIRSGVKDRRCVFYEPFNREGFSSHIAEFGG